MPSVTLTLVTVYYRCAGLCLMSSSVDYYCIKQTKKRRLPERDDEDDSDMYDDEVDLFHKQKEKILLDNNDHGQSDESEEEEVLPVVESSDSDDEEIAMYKQQLRQMKRMKMKKKMDSDLEDEGGPEDDLPDSKAWGSKRSWFQGGDVRDNKIILSGSEDEAGAAALEEKESLAIQKRLAAQLNEEDFLLSRVTKPDKSSEKQMKELIKVKTDLSKMSRKQELELMKKEHPEYLPLVADFRAKAGKIQGTEAEYIRCKFHINSRYIINGGFYMYLMAKRSPVHNHPVIKRLVQFKNLSKMLEPVDRQVEGQIKELLAKIKQGEDIDLRSSQPERKRRKFTHREEQLAEHGAEERDTGAPDDEEEEGEDSAEKRAITYQMEKNKGLTAQKRKELRNPRVKHRAKFRRAKIRRKGQVREHKPQGHYGGELTGIRAGVIRSRKMK
ncbi:hypothetical protein BaRGS_00007550 [Batillaria attramentaria]|uniref:Sas10 C-terminal domain-containing protein n=1 Tax=Batillaria attramentaria TaxID=370345 RepID=A0ABD0LNE7_9CAEN